MHVLLAIEKLIFSIVVIGGGLIATTGYILLFSFCGTGIANRQVAQIVHSTAGVFYIAAMLTHAYMGTLATKARSKAGKGASLSLCM